MEKSSKSLYSELEVEKSATEQEIKKAYKKLALKWHPDKNENSEQATEKFKKISEAYSILSNVEQREYYDRTGKIKSEGEFASNFEGMFASSAFFTNFASFAQMFDDSDDDDGGVFISMSDLFRS